MWWSGKLLFNELSLRYCIKEKAKKNVYNRTSMISGTEQMTVTMKTKRISRYQTDKALTYISVVRRTFKRGIPINN